MARLQQPDDSRDFDWRGIAVAESSVIVGSGDLYSLAGLNHEEWSIVGIDISTMSHGKPPSWRVSVYAVNKQRYDVTSYEAMRELEARSGSALPVREVSLPKVSLDDVVRCMKDIHVQLLAQEFPRLDVVEKAAYPVQDSV